MVFNIISIRSERLVSNMVTDAYLLYHHLQMVLINGSQLAKMKKSIPYNVPAIKFIGMKQLV